MQFDNATILTNNHIDIVIGNKGGLVSFVDKRSGYDFITAPNQPLYELLMFAQGRDLIEIRSEQAATFRLERNLSESGETLVLSYQHRDNLELDISCSISFSSDSPISEWRLSVINHTAYGVRAIRFPVLITPAILGDSDEDDYFAWGWLGGALDHRPGKKPSPVPRKKYRAEGGHGDNWFPLQYPGPIGLQMQAYYDSAAGLYMATHDPTGSVKSFGSLPVEQGLDLTIEHNYDESPGLNFDLPYPTVIGVFHGDWYEAADIYKGWARKQAWCTRKTIARDDIPEWLKEPRPWLATIGRGNYARLQGILTYPPAEPPLGKFWPACKVVPMIRAYSEKFGTPVITWMEGWENHGSPSGPVDIFPPSEGEVSFAATMAELNRDGNYPFMYLAAFHWWYKTPTVGYDAWDRFEKEGQAMAALNDQNGFIVNDIEKRPYGGGQGYYVSLCSGSEAVHDKVLENFLKLIQLGGVAVSLDIQIGLFAYPCYSQEHGHTAGYGPWMYHETVKFLRRVRKEIRQRNPMAALGYEIPCELWLQEVDFQYHRPYRIGAIPLFDYLYGEYGCFLGGDVIMGVAHPEEEVLKQATIFVQGVQNLVGIGLPEYDYEVDQDYPAIKMMRNISKAQRTFAHKYVVFGEMLRPSELNVSYRNVDLYRQPGFVSIPEVLHSLWRAPDGDLGHLLVNWTDSPSEVVLILVEDQEGSSRGNIKLFTTSMMETLAYKVLNSGEISMTISPRQIVLVEQVFS